MEVQEYATFIFRSDRLWHQHKHVHAAHGRLLKLDAKLLAHCGQKGFGRGCHFGDQLFPFGDAFRVNVPRRRRRADQGAHFRADVLRNGK